MRFFSLFLGLCLILPNVSMAACGVKHVSYVGNQDPDDDEYVYQFWGTFDEAKKNHEKKDFDFDITGSGHVWECDSHQCKDGTWLLLDKNSVHKGSRYTKPTLYMCNTNSADRWEIKTLYDCYEQWGKQAEPKPGWRKVATPNGPWASTRYPGAKFYENGYHGKLCVLTADRVSQKQNLRRDCDKTAVCAGIEHAGYCAKVTTAEGCKLGVVLCDGGYKVQKPIGAIEGIGTVYAKCVKQSGGTTASSQSTVVVHKNTTVVQQVTPSNSSTGGKQACESSGGTWKNKKCSCASEKYLVLNGNVCECTAGYSRNDQKVCVPTDETNCKNLDKSVAEWKNNQCVCVDKRQIYSSVTKNCITNPEVTKCDKVADAKWTGDKCECIKQGYELKDGKCVKGAALVSLEQKDSRAKITSVYKKLNAMSGDFKVSVWKNADGNFNTARLASDSIAAVVLGTTGALVTSNIVKKNQVSGGFEDINCQVGGQTVAGWGDQFSVGIQ